MPPSSGFGRSRFGHGPFGEADWAHNSWWLSVPAVYRDNDPDGLLEVLLRSYGDSFDDIRHKMRGLPDLRNPLRIRTRYNGTAELDLTAATPVASSEASDGVAHTILEVSVATLPSMKEVGPGWVLEAPERNYIVKSVSKVDGLFVVLGDDPPSLGLTTLRPPSLIEHLGRDFGLEIDGYEPEGFQRGLISESVKWYNLKGTEDGIILRAKLAGFSASVRSLWAIDPGYVGYIPASNLFELESGSYYTDIEPGFVQFDDVPADVIATDVLCSTTPVQYPITVTTVTAVGPLWRVETSTPLTMVANPTGQWKILLGDDEFYAEAIDADLGHIYVAGEVEPALGAYTLEYDCRPVSTCGWCKSYKIVLDLVPVSEELLTNPTALDGAFDRLIAKIDAILPAHVQVVYVLVTEGGDTMAISASGVSETYIFGAFDTIPADVQPADTATSIVSA